MRQALPDIFEETEETRPGFVLSGGQPFVRCDFRGAVLSFQAYGSHFIDCDLRGANLEGLRMKDTVFTRCKLAGLTGKPVIEGPIELNDADFSIDATDAAASASSGAGSAEELRQRWQS